MSSSAQDRWADIAAVAPSRLAPHRRADRVLTVVLGILHAVAGGVPTEDAVCTGLAREVDAVVAAYVALGPDEATARVVAWPPTADLAGLQALLAHLPEAASYLLHQVALDTRVLCRSRDGDRFPWWEAITAMNVASASCGGDVAQVPLDACRPGGRVILLGRARRFDADAVTLLDALRDPLADVVRIAGEQPAPALPRPPVDHGLTEREIEILQLISEGLLAQTIAMRLAVSPRTVHKHLGNIYRKLDAHDRLVAVRRAEVLGLLPARSATPLVAAPASRG